jgi:uncharacterized protein
MRIWPILAVVLLLAGAAGKDAGADDAPSPETLQAANELFSVLSVGTMDQLTRQMAATIWPKVEQQARADKIDDATIAELRQEFERLQLAFVTAAMKDAPPIYARHFSAAELRDLIAFYRTPLGAKSLREMPQAMAEFTALLLPRLQDLQQQTRQSFEKILREHGYVK